MDSSMKPRSRREFIKGVAGKAFYTLGIAVLCYPVLSFMTFRKSRKREVVFSLSEQLSPVQYKEGVYLVNKSGETFPISSRCTHLGCTVQYDRILHRFQCPCHGSSFDISGKRISGPAKEDLPRQPFSREDNKDIKVTIRL